MVWGLQTKNRSKLRVIAAFSSRLMYASYDSAISLFDLTNPSPIAFSALHFRSWSSYSEHTPSTLTIVPAIVWQEVLSTVSIFAAQLLILRSLLHSISAGWEATQWPGATGALEKQRFEPDVVGRIREQMAGSSSSTLVFPSGRASKSSERKDGQITGLKIVRIELKDLRQPRGFNGSNN